MAEPPVIPIICGPTASGKTAAALEVAKHVDIEIVSADSRQMVRHLDIGTGKPTPEERRQVPFHLIDIVEPGVRYSAYRFIEDASRAISEILERGRRPLLVGGTGFYLRALTDGVVEIQTDDMVIRDQLEQELQIVGPERMHDRLKEIDPIEASRLHPNNRVRIVRALEIFLMTGKTKSELTAHGHYRKSPYRYDYLCLIPERAALYEKINSRVEAMIGAGLIEEIKGLIARGYKEQVRSANIIGYNELLDFMGGAMTLEEAKRIIKQNSRRYAKRQMTWFRRQVGCRYFANEGSLFNAVTPLLEGKV